MIQMGQFSFYLMLISAIISSTFNLVLKQHIGLSIFSITVCGCVIATYIIYETYKKIKFI